MKIPQEFSEFYDEILKYIESPMFFIYDNELINMYSYLSRLSDSELQIICKDNKYHKMCDIVTGERRSDYGDLKQFVNERGMLNIEGLLPILSSFPSFNDMMNFIMRIKPGFRYTKEFKELVEQHIVVENTKNVNGDDIIRYTLGIYTYEIHDSEDYLDITYYKNGKLHRKNGPAIIAMVRTDVSTVFVTEWYNEGKRHREGDLPSFIEYSVKARKTYIERIYKWYTNDKLDRENGPAVIRLLQPLRDPDILIRNSNTLLSIRRNSQAGIIETEFRNSNQPKHKIISGEGDNRIEEYYKNGEKIYV